MMKKAITLTEVVTIIIVIFLLSMFSLPRYFRLKQEAKEISESGVVGSIRAGIYKYVAEEKQWPSQLDNAPAGSKASQKNPFFNIIDPKEKAYTGWAKDLRSETLYHSPANNIYEYNAVTGEFLKVNY